ncbi:MAG: hypothetical protein WCB36_09840 [Burkholderiales bacterium]
MGRSLNKAKARVERDSSGIVSIDAEREDLGTRMVGGLRKQKLTQCATETNAAHVGRDDDAGDGGRTPSPGRWYAVHFYRPGPGGVPLGLGLSEGLGVAVGTSRKER